MSDVLGYIIIEHDGLRGTYKPDDVFYFDLDDARDDAIALRDARAASPAPSEYFVAELTRVWSLAEGAT